MTKSEFLLVRQAAPSVQIPTQFFHSRLSLFNETIKTLNFSLLVLRVGNSETLKMSSFVSLLSWSIYRTYVSKMLLFWISVDSSSCNANNFEFLIFFSELLFCIFCHIRYPPLNSIILQWDVFHFTCRRLA